MIPQEQISEWFDCFWAIYWRKVAKKDALRAFQKQVHSEETFSKVMDGVRLQHYAMMKRQPDFRPHAATWLNGWRWNDRMNHVSGGYVPFQASSEQQAINGKYEYEEDVTLPAIPTVPEGPTADEWRKKNAR